MINQDLLLPSLIDTSGVDPEERGVEYWQEAYLKLRQENIELETKLSAAEKESAELKKELAELKEKINKLEGRNSENSSQPPSQDGYKKKNKKWETKVNQFWILDFGF